MRQILYVSHSNGPVGQDELDAILQQSRHYNALDGVTGLLWSDGQRFVQVLVGDDEAVADAMRRIGADPRHRALEIVHDLPIEDREFGSWSMELRGGGHDDRGYEQRMQRLLEGAAPSIRDEFASLMAPAAT